MLSPHQFGEPEPTKIDLGTHHLNASFDQRERATAEYKATGGGGRSPLTKPAPDGYYHQPPSGVRQMALPGMEMSVQDHLDALGKATGLRASIDSGTLSHRIALHRVEEEGEKTYGYGTEKGHLSYSNERPEQGVRDNGDTIGVGHPNAYHAGEIRMVRSYVPGGAGKMLETAEKLATEHGYAFPKHSWDRTGPGVRWSQKQMKKRGEPVW